MRRIDEIDFVKCVMILLMIAFHLVWFGDTYGAAKAFVYTFHMPVFLIISGFFLNIDKPWKKFWRSMMFIAIPYAIMEAGYIAGAAILPIREHIDGLTPWIFLDKLVLHPIGPYWYLQTLIICSIIAKGICWTTRRLNINLVMCDTLLLFCVFIVMAQTGFVALSSCMYFTMGVFARLLAQRRYASIADTEFYSHWMCIVMLTAMAFIVKDPDRGTFMGVLITLMAFGTSLQLYKLADRYATRLKTMCLFIGRNTLLLLLFSPIFTILAKAYQPMLLSVEPTGILFMIVSVVFAVAGSLALGYIADLMKISKFIFGRKAIS